MKEPKRKPPRHIIGFFTDPNSWDRKSFETAVREEIETLTGPVTPSDEILIGNLVLQMESLIEAQIHILEEGSISQYSAGVGSSAWVKIRNEATDKVIKILGELGLVARGRPKLQNKATTVDELFAPA